MLAVLAALVACGTAGGGSATGGPGDPVPAQLRWLEGRTFLSHEIRTEDPVSLAPDTVLSLAFRDGRVAAYAGCNHMSGTASLDRTGRLAVADLVQTEIGCPDPGVTERDAWFAGLLTRGPTLRLAGETLYVEADSARGTTRLVMWDKSLTTTDSPLLETTWTLVGLGTGSGPDAAVGSVPAGVVSTLVIGAGGRVSARLGCNSGSASATVTGSEVDVGAIAATRMACDDDRMRVERAVTAILRGRSAYTIDGPSLTLTSGRGTLMYSADPPADPPADPQVDPPADPRAGLTPPVVPGGPGEPALLATRWLMTAHGPNSGGPGPGEAAEAVGPDAGMTLRVTAAGTMSGGRLPVRLELSCAGAAGGLLLGPTPPAAAGRLQVTSLMHDPGAGCDGRPTAAVAAQRRVLGAPGGVGYELQAGVLRLTSTGGVLLYKPAP